MFCLEELFNKTWSWKDFTISWLQMKEVNENFFTTSSISYLSAGHFNHHASQTPYIRSPPIACLVLACLGDNFRCHVRCMDRWKIKKNGKWSKFKISTFLFAIWERICNRKKKTCQFLCNFYLRKINGSWSSLKHFLVFLHWHMVIQCLYTFSAFSSYRLFS